VEFTTNLNDLPEEIQKLVFIGSINGAGTMSEISEHKIFIGEKISADFSGADFEQEKAITSLEIYRKNGWRFNVVARGFNGGLEDLLAFYGAEITDNHLEIIGKLKKLGLDSDTINQLLAHMQDIEPKRRQDFINAVDVLADDNFSTNTVQKKEAYNIFCKEFSQLDAKISDKPADGKIKGMIDAAGKKISSAVDSATSFISTATVSDTVKNTGKKVAKGAAKGAVRGALKAGGITVGIAGTAIGVAAASIVPVVAIGAVVGGVGAVFDGFIDN